MASLSSKYNTKYIIIKRLTSVDDLAEEILPPEKVLGRAVPPAVAKLMLALGDGLVGASRHRHQNSRILSR